MKRYNLLVPLAGKGQRMIDGGYRFPKPLIMAGDKTIIEHGLNSIDLLDANLIFVVRRDHIHNWAIDRALKRMFSHRVEGDIKFVVAERETAGSVDSCYLAKDLIDNDLPLVVFTSDVEFAPVFRPDAQTFENDGLLLTFKANSDRYSYVQKDELGYVTKTAEKVVISEDANAGVYCFKAGSTFCRLAEATMALPGEHYLAPLYNLLIAAGGKVRSLGVRDMYIMGTPDELKFYEKAVFPYSLPRGLILCSDHSGFDRKNELVEYLSRTKVPFFDVGCPSDNDCDYADYIGRAMELRKYYPGYIIMGFCRSGQGVNICANKHEGIRAVLARDREGASLGIRHNAANFISIAAGIVHGDELEAIADTVMRESFEGGRHQNRLQKLGDF